MQVIYTICCMFLNNFGLFKYTRVSVLKCTVLIKRYFPIVNYPRFYSIERWVNSYPFIETYQSCVIHFFLFMNENYD